MTASESTVPPVSRDLAIIAAVVVGCLVLFVDKPLHVDDPLFVWSAERIRIDPTDFFAGDVNWNGEPARLADVTKNPPLACYLLALWSLAIGWNERWLHILFMLQAVAAAWGAYFLSRRFCTHPLFAVLIAIATPAFLVSATSLMCDVLMLAFWCWAIELWWRGLDRRCPRYFAVSGLCTAAAILSKYFAVSLFPLLIYLTLVRPGSSRRTLGWLLLPLATVAAFEAYAYAKYGTFLFGEAMYFASKAQYDKLYVSAIAKAYGSIVYVGGCLVTTLLLAPSLWSKRALAAQLAVAAALVATAIVVGSLRELSIRQGSHFDWNAVAHLVVFTLAGLQILWLVANDLWRSPHGPSSDWNRWQSGFLTLGVAGTWLFAAGINWTINARSLLPAAPLVGMLIVRQWERSHAEVASRARATAPLAAFVGLGLAATIWITWGDYRTAVTFRRAAVGAAARYSDPANPPWFQGHWGFQYYMQQAGARPMDYAASPVARPGDRVIVPRFGNHLRIPTSAEARLIDTTFTPYEVPLATLSDELQAMFYAQAAFPFRIVQQKPAECLIFEYR